MPRMTGDIGTTVSNAWTGFLDALTSVLSPEWSALVALLPLLLLPLVLLYLAAAAGGWTIYGITKPRAKVRWELGARPLELDAGGSPVVPVGLPFSLRTGLVYPAGVVRTDDGEDLVVICPMCQVERPAQIPQCGNCGLVLNVKQAMTVARPAGPPPGGAALA